MWHGSSHKLPPGKCTTGQGFFFQMTLKLVLIWHKTSQHIHQELSSIHLAKSTSHQFLIYITDLYKLNYILFSKHTSTFLTLVSSGYISFWYIFTYGNYAYPVSPKNFNLILKSNVKFLWSSQRSTLPSVSHPIQVSILIIHYLTYKIRTSRS